MTRLPKVGIVAIASLAISVAFWIGGFMIAPDQAAFVDNRSWLYQIIYLPAHVICAYLAILIYQGARSACGSEVPPAPGRLPYVAHGLKHLGIASLAVMPFLVMDGLQGYGMVIEEFSSMGQAGWLLLCIWAIEWVATGVLWVNVLYTFRLTVSFYSEEYVRQHLDELLITNRSSPLLMAGVENSLVILVFAAATFGYILWAGGQLADFFALGVSAVFVLLAFVGSMLHLKRRVNRALDEHYEDSLASFIGSVMPGARGSGSTMSAESLQAIDGVVFARPSGLSPRSYARLRVIKATQLLKLGNGSDSQHVLLEILKHTEYELRLASVGTAELRAVLVRLTAPVAGVLAKSGLFGGF